MSETKKTRRRGRTGRAVRRWLKRLILLVIVLAAALFLLRAYIRNQAAGTDAADSYSTAQAVRGAMQETVYGTGTTSARNQPNILAEADGTLTDLRVAVGDEVSAGDILAVLTNEDIDDTITDLEFSLWDLDDTITGTAAGSKATAIEAPASGRIMAVYAQKGDDALAVFRREGALAIISTDGRMKVELVSEGGSLGLTLDERVTVSGDNIYAVGTVVDLTRQGTCATITVLESDLPLKSDLDGDGAYDVVMGRSVIVRNAREEVVGQGTLEPNKPMAVSSFGGTIKSVRAKVGEEITRAETMFTLEDSPLTLTLENLRLQREAAAKELEDAKAQRENLIIVAPCDGTIASLNVEEGDEITSGTLIGSILQGEDMNLTIAVDELDVVEVEVGQKVAITIDALSSLALEGEVYKIAPVGTNSGGVTTYNVELTFDATGTGVRSGMNATGEIEVASKEDTLYVPVEALMTVNNQTYVMVADGGVTTLADAAASQSSRSGKSGERQSGSRGTEAGGAPAQGAVPGEGGMPQRGGAPAGGMSDASAAGSAGGAGTAEDAEKQSVLDTLKAKVTGVFAGVRAWLYEGVETNSAQQVTGSLVRVDIGMQNDDYAEILSGLSEGDVVLYTSSSSSSTTSMFGGGSNRNMGGMGGMGGPMGF